MRRCWAEIDLGALRENLGWLRHRVGPRTKILTVVKADAYGHGLRQVAGLLMQSGTDIFGVANLEEAMEIRRIGGGWPILMLGCNLESEVETAVRERIMPTISSVAEAEMFSAAARRLGTVVEAHVKVDTGMGRLGARPEEAVELAARVRELPGLRWQGLYTHFSSAEEDEAFTRQQRETFDAAVRRMAEAGLEPPLIHAHNSAALLYESGTFYGVARPGLLVYGVLPSGRRLVEPSLWHGQLRPALAFKCRVGFLKEVARGTPLSYGRAFTAPGSMRVATVTAGYGDGYMRAGSNRARVLIRGRRCPVVGRITMDQTLVDVTAVEGVSRGDEVVLVGRQQEEEITANEVADWCGTVPWETLTSITHRVPRIYRGGGAA